MNKVQNFFKNRWDDVKNHPKTYGISLGTAGVIALAGIALVGLSLANVDLSSVTSLADRVVDGGGALADSHLLEIGAATTVVGIVGGGTAIVTTRLIQKKLKRSPAEEVRKILEDLSERKIDTPIYGAFYSSSMDLSIDASLGAFSSRDLTPEVTQSYLRTLDYNIDISDIGRDSYFAFTHQGSAFILKLNSDSKIVDVTKVTAPEGTAIQGLNAEIQGTDLHLTFTQE